jgi:sugar/nucleoside kinase (ribokinase family)
MGEGYENFYAQAVLWAKQKGVKIAFNPGTRQVKAGVLHLDYAYDQTDVLFVNKEEAQSLMGISDMRVDMKKLLVQVRTLGPKVVVITDGMAGTYVHDGVKYWHMPIVPAKVVERTGAGDAFGSGFMAAIIGGKTIQEAMRWGTVNSASVLEYIGPQAGLLDNQGIQERLRVNAGVGVEEF